MVLAGQAVEGEGLLDIVFNPADELFVAAAPFGDPSREIAAGFLDRASIVESAQLLQAVAVGLARQMVESICGGSGRSTVGRRPRREPLEWPCAVRRDRRRRRTRRHAGPAGAKKGGSLSRMIGSRGWPSRRRGSGGARPSRRRWFSRSGPDRFATCPLTKVHCFAFICVWLWIVPRAQLGKPFGRLPGSSGPYAPAYVGLVSTAALLVDLGEPLVLWLETRFRSLAVANRERNPLKPTTSLVFKPL